MGEPRGGLTPASLASLLSRLHAEPERAGVAYETLRRSLVGFFTWRGAGMPEECADETLDRLAARLAEGEVVEDVPRYARGIARLVLLEQWRRPDGRRERLDEIGADVASPPDPSEEALHECLDTCLAALAHDGRELILGYYAGDGRERIDNRRRLAAALGVTETALRNRAQRLRDRLERCIADCLRGQGTHGPRRAADTKE